MEYYTSIINKFILWNFKKIQKFLEVQMQRTDLKKYKQSDPSLFF